MSHGTIEQPCPTCGKPRAVVNGAWLRGRRERAGVSLRATARALKISAPYLSDIERNQRGCPVAVLAHYKKAL